MKTRLTIMFLILSFVPFVSAQEFDDVFFSPSRDKAEREAAQVVRDAEIAARQTDNTLERANERDVDEYNRRTGSFVIAETNDDIMAGDGRLEYSSQINRSQGGNVFINDADVFVDHVTGNIFITGDGFANNWSTWSSPSPWGFNSWGGHFALFDPWFTPTWRWTTGWGWGSPGWGWSLGWNSNWGWNSPWYWNAGWGWGDPYWGGGWWHRPVSPIWHAPRGHNFRYNRTPYSRRSITTTTPSRRSNSIGTGTSRRNNSAVTNGTPTRDNRGRFGTVPSGTRRGDSNANINSGATRRNPNVTRPSGSRRENVFSPPRDVSRSRGNSSGTINSGSNRFSGGGFSTGGSSRGGGFSTGGGSRGGGSRGGGSRR